jgi:hypothetical protein
MFEFVIRTTGIPGCRQNWLEEEDEALVEMGRGPRLGGMGGRSFDSASRGKTASGCAQDDGPYMSTRPVSLHPEVERSIMVVRPNRFFERRNPATSSLLLFSIEPL